MNELVNDDDTFSKHEINIDFIMSLPIKWLIFNQGLRNANHFKNLELAEIYGIYVY